MLTLKKRFPSLQSLGSDGNTSFLRAARAGNLEKVLEHLKNNIDINTCNANGLNALHLASKDGHVAVVQELLSRGATVDAATKKGNTALHIASLAGQEDVVKLLIQKNASVNVQSQNGFTPLYMAAQENHDSVVRLLLSNGANQSLATEDGFTPLAVAMQQGHDKVVAVLLESDTRGKVRLPALHIAAKKDDVKAATLLLENDHNPDVTSKSGFTPLHIASHYGNEGMANLLIQKGADVNFAAKHNISPLHVAAKWGKTNMVALLLEKGANIESRTRDGLTPLHCAARSGHEQVVDMLLERGAPISAKTKNGLAPLHMAAQGEHVDAARILLYHRAPVDEVTVDYLTALHVAAHCGHVRVAKLLLDRNADANARALNGFTPLHIACKKNRIKVVELLLKHGASISATTESGLTPLHVASFMGCMNIVIYLLQHEANPDVPTVRGETPLHLAARANQTDIIRILLRNGAQVDARAREQQTPLHIASRLGNVDIVMLLLQHGAQVDAVTKDMYTALHIAAKEGQDEVASVLLENGAQIDATTKKGFTPLHLSAKYGHMKVAELMLQKNSPVDAQGKNGVTPLHVASHYDHQNVALLLLEKGASPHATAKNGHTPLHIAARKNQMDIATTLLEYGAQANAESKAGFTPLHLSSQEGHTDMSSLLLEHKADPDHQARNGLTPIHLCAQEDRVDVAKILVKHGANIEAQTKAGYTPLHVAAHFGQANMVRYLIQEGVKVNDSTSIGYSPLHQAAQQGHCHIVHILLENNADPNAVTNNGQTPLNIAQKLGYISVLDSLKTVTEDNTSPMQTSMTDEKYRVVAPEAMHETFMSDSEEEGGEDTVLSDQPYRYLTVDEMKSLGDDSLPIDVTRDERIDSNKMTQSHDSTQLPPTAMEDSISPQHVQMVTSGISTTDSVHVDNVNIERQPAHAGKLHWKNFLVSFLVDARGGAMRGCRHSGVRIIVPARTAAQPTRITCRYVKPQRTLHPPPLMEGEALASRVLELGPVGAKFLGPVIMEVPHFASLRGKEREIVILRSDNGENWREHSIDSSDEIIHDILNECFEPEDIAQLDELGGGRICRFVTYDFPQYFAVISRIRQEVHAIGPEGGMVSSTVVPQVQAVFPQGALTKKIKVGLQAQPIDPDLTAKLLGRGVAVSPVVTVEPRRRKFHKAITLSMPAPRAHSQGMINQYSGNAPTLRLLCSITGGTTRAQWEDVTGSTPLTFVNDCVSFTTTVSARFWLMDCRNIADATKMATELYKEAIHVPFMAKFVVFAKRTDPLEAKLRVFCMTDDREDKTLEHQESFTEVAKSRDVEVLEDKLQYIELAGNLVPITKSGEQLHLPFKAFRENRLPFSVRVKDQHADIVGRTLFMREPKIAKGEPPQQPICILNIVLPDNIIPEQVITLDEHHEIITRTETSRLQHGNKDDQNYLGDMRIVDISNLLGEDWIKLAPEIGINETDADNIVAQHPSSTAQQAQAMLKLFRSKPKNDLNILEDGLRTIHRTDIVERCIQTTTTTTVTMRSKTAFSIGRRSVEHRSYEENDMMKDSESLEELVQKEDRFHESKYSAEEKIVEDSEESEEETIKKTVAERRKQIEKRLSGERSIPASAQKKELVEEIISIKRQSLIDDARAKHEEEIYMQKPIDNSYKSSTIPEPVVKLKTTHLKDGSAVDKSEFDKELQVKFKSTLKDIDNFEHKSQVLLEKSKSDDDYVEISEKELKERIPEMASKTTVVMTSTESSKITSKIETDQTKITSVTEIITKVPVEEPIAIVKKLDKIESVLPPKEELVTEVKEEEDENLHLKKVSEKIDMFEAQKLDVSQKVSEKLESKIFEKFNKKDSLSDLESHIIKNGDLTTVESVISHESNITKSEFTKFTESKKSEIISGLQREIEETKSEVSDKHETVSQTMETIKSDADSKIVSTEAKISEKVESIATELTQKSSDAQTTIEKTTSQKSEEAASQLSKVEEKIKDEVKAFETKVDTAYMAAATEVTEKLEVVGEKIEATKTEVSEKLIDQISAIDKKTKESEKIVSETVAASKLQVEEIETKASAIVGQFADTLEGEKSHMVKEKTTGEKQLNETVEGVKVGISEKTEEITTKIASKIPIFDSKIPKVDKKSPEKPDDHKKDHKESKIPVMKTPPEVKSTTMTTIEKDDDVTTVTKVTETIETLPGDVEAVVTTKTTEIVSKIPKLTTKEETHTRIPMLRQKKISEQISDESKSSTTTIESVTQGPDGSEITTIETVTTTVIEPAKSSSIESQEDIKIDQISSKEVKEVLSFMTIDEDLLSKFADEDKIETSEKLVKEVIEKAQEKVKEIQSTELEDVVSNREDMKVEDKVEEAAEVEEETDEMPIFHHSVHVQEQQDADFIEDDYQASVDKDDEPLDSDSIKEHQEGPQQPEKLDSQIPMPTPRLSKPSLSEDDTSTDSLLQRKEFYDTLEKTNDDQASPVPKPRQQVLVSTDEIKSSFDTDTSSIQSSDLLFKQDTKEDDERMIDDESYPITDDYSESKATSVQTKVKDDMSLLSLDQIQSLPRDMKTDAADESTIEVLEIIEGDGGEPVPLPLELYGGEEDEDDGAKFYIGESSRNIITRSTTERRSTYAFDNEAYECSMDEPVDKLEESELLQHSEVSRFQVTTHVEVLQTKTDETESKTSGEFVQPIQMADINKPVIREMFEKKGTKEIEAIKTVEMTKTETKATKEIEAVKLVEMTKTEASVSENTTEILKTGEKASVEVEDVEATSIDKTELTKSTKAAELSETIKSVEMSRIETKSSIEIEDVKASKLSEATEALEMLKTETKTFESADTLKSMEITKTELKASKLTEVTKSVDMIKTETKTLKDELMKSVEMAFEDFEVLKPLGKIEDVKEAAEVKKEKTVTESDPMDKKLSLDLDTEKTYPRVVHSPVKPIKEPIMSEKSREIEILEMAKASVIDDLTSEEKIMLQRTIDELVIEKTLEEVEESLEAAKEELIEVTKDGKLIKESPSEFEFKVLPSAVIKTQPQAPIIESHQEEQPVEKAVIKIKEPVTVEEEKSDPQREESPVLSSTTEDSFNKLDVKHRKGKMHSPPGGNRWSVTDIESSSGESHYQSFERPDSRPLSSSDIDKLQSSEYETASAAQSEYVSAVSTLHSHYTPSMRSLDSESSGNLGSISSEASETLIPSTMDIEGEISDVNLPHDSDADLEDDQEDKCGSLEDKEPGILIEGDEDSSFISGAMKRSQEMTFYPELKEDLVQKGDVTYDSFEDTKFSTSIEIVKYGDLIEGHKMTSSMEDIKIDESRLATSLEDGSLLSISLSSASNIETIMENLPHGSEYRESPLIGSLDSAKIFMESMEGMEIMETCTTPTQLDENLVMSSMITDESLLSEEQTRKRGHKRNDSTVLTGAPLFKAGESKESQDSSSLDDEVAIQEDSSEHMTSEKDETREESSDSDFDRYETEYSRSFKCPVNQGKRKERKPEVFEKDIIEVERRSSFSPGQSVIETIVEDEALEEELAIEADMIMERKLSQNIQDFSIIPDIQVTIQDEIAMDMEKEEAKIDLNEKIQYAQQIELKEEPVVKPEPETAFTYVPPPQLPVEKAPPSPDGSDSFEMLEQPDFADEFVIVEEVAREAQEDDAEGQSMAIQKMKRDVKKHDEELEKYLTKSAPAHPNTGSMYGNIRDDMIYDFEESPPLGSDLDSAGVSTRDLLDSGGYPLEESKRWVEMQLADTQNLRYPYEDRLEDIKEEDGEFEVGSSRISSFKDSFSSTPDFDLLAKRLRSHEHDDISVNSLQEFENLEHVISLENRKLMQGSQDSLSNGSFSKRFLARSAQGDDISLSSLKDFEGLESACIEAQLLESKVKEEAALLLSRSDDSNKSDSSNDFKKGSPKARVIATTIVATTSSMKDVQKETFSQSTTTTTTSTTSVSQKLAGFEEEDSSRLMTISTDSLEGLSRPLTKSTYDKDSHHTSSDSLEMNNKNMLDLMTSSVDSIEVSRTGATTRSSRSDSIEQMAAEPKRSDSTDSIEQQVAMMSQGSRMQRDSLEDTVAFDLDSIGSSSLMQQQHLLQKTTTVVKTVTQQYEMHKDISNDSLNNQDLLITSTDSIETSSTATNATYQNRSADSQMSGSITSCDSTTMVDQETTAYMTMSTSQIHYEYEESQLSGSGYAATGDLAFDDSKESPKEKQQSRTEKDEEQK